MKVLYPLRRSDGWAVDCPDGNRRHTGLFATDIAAHHWANQRRCCTLTGHHHIHLQAGPKHLARPPRVEVA